MRKIENKKHESEKIKAKTNKIYCNKGINMKGITLSVVTSSSTREITGVAMCTQDVYYNLAHVCLAGRLCRLQVM